MKRTLLIGAGTIGGIGAVLSITPPNFGSAESAGQLLSGNPSLASSGSSQPSQTPSAAVSTPVAPVPESSTPTPVHSAAPVPTKSSSTSTAKPRGTTTATAKATHSATPTPVTSQTQAASQTPVPVKSETPTPTKTATPTPTPTPTPTKKTGISGTFSGSAFQTRYGAVQVEITVVDNKITSARALQVPNRDFRSSNISSQAVPYLIEETLQAQSANIQGVGGASYTSYGWQQSLASALAKAGL